MKRRTQPQHQLRAERLQRGWLQQDVADRLGTTTVTVSRWENGVSIPSPYFRLKLMQLFEKSAQELGLQQTDENADDIREETGTPLDKAASDDASQDAQLRDLEHATQSAPLPGEVSFKSVSAHEWSVSRQQRYNRQRMIEQVSQVWINGMLKQSLHGAALLTLGLREKSQVVANPWSLEMEQLDQLLPEGTTITQAYDMAHGQLLILGEPGAGKTTLLLELTQNLLERTQEDDLHPIPVVFNMSSWAVRRQPLADWLVEELQVKYQVPRSLGKEWVARDVILPLLDGLDEVALSQRSACVDAINRFRREHGLLPTVVCSRYEDYLAQRSHVQLRNAVIVQPLTTQQVQKYLAFFGEGVNGLAQVLEEDEETRTLAATPLMLTILTRTYQGSLLQDLVQDSPQEGRQRQVFEGYVERMLRRRSAAYHYSAQRTKYWLTRLAARLIEQQQTEMYVEAMQFDWQRAPRIARLLPVAGLGITYGLLLGFVLAIFNGLFYGLRPALMFGVTLSAFNILLYILLNGMIVVVGDSNPEAAHKGQGNDPLISRLIRPLVSVIEKRIVYGLIFAVCNGLFYGLIMATLPEIYLLLASRFPYELTYGLFIGCAYGVEGKLDLFVSPAEVISWSWQHAKTRIRKFLALAIVIGFILGIIYPLPVKLALILLAMIISIVVSGVSNKALEGRQRLRPNQGIRRSVRNSLLIGALTGFLIWIFLGGLFSIFYGVSIGLFYGCIPGLGVGICMGLHQGGRAFCLHMMVRIQHWSTGECPWNYVRFLDEAAKKMLLRKIGGSYIFIHRSLMEYFASLDVNSEDYTQIDAEIERVARRQLLGGLGAIVLGSGCATFATLPTLLTSPSGTLLYMYMKHTNKVHSVDISPDSVLVASGSDDGIVRVWDAMSGTDAFVLQASTHIISSIAWSPDGTSIASGDDAGIIQIWDMKQKSRKLTYTGHRGVMNFTRVLWSPNGKMLASSGSDGAIHVWSSNNGQKLASFEADADTHETGAGITWSPDNMFLVFREKNSYSLRVLSVATENVVQTLTCQMNTIAAIAWSADGKHLAAASFDGTVSIWRRTQQGPLLISKPYAIINQTEALLLSMRWSSQSASLLVAGTQGVQVWEIAPVKHIFTYTNHTGRIFSTAWARNGKFIVSSDSNNNVHVWTVP